MRKNKVPVKMIMYEMREHISGKMYYWCYFLVSVLFSREVQSLNKINEMPTLLHSQYYRRFLAKHQKHLLIKFSQISFLN